MTDPEAWRTDPRERLLAAIDRTWARGELGATPEQLVDAFADHLAEQIRRNAQARHDRDFSDNRIFRLAGARVAANSIDPKVEAQQ